MLLDVLLWILFIGFISLICLPAYSFLFKENILIKLSLGAPISLIIVGLTSWVAFFILKEIYISYLFSITVISIIFILWLYKNKHNFFSIFNYKSLIFLLLLVISHLFFISIRGFNGDLIGTEKLMDQMMLSSTFYSDNGLVPDLWLSDYQNPYYYLAYWIFGGVIKMSGIDLVLGYNLSLSTTFSLSLLTSWAVSLGLLKRINLPRYKSYLISIFGPLYLLFITNFYILFDLLARLPLIGNILSSLVKIKGLGDPDPNFLFGSGWRSTRVIDYLVEGKSLDYTIQEYPSFSFILGDLHPHLLSIPFFLSLSYLIISITSYAYDRDFKNRIVIFFIIGLLIPIMGFINIWDLPFFIFLFLICYLLSYIKNKNKNYLYEVSTFFIAFMISILMLSNYYFVTLGGQTQPPFVALNLYSTNIMHLLIVMGLPLIIIYASIFRNINIRQINLLKVISFSFILSILLFGIRGLFFFSELNNEIFINYLLSFFSTLVLIFPIYIILKEKLFLKDHMLYSISLTILFILLIVEHVHLIDLFGNRMNTIFKSYYQVWILASIMFPIIVIKSFPRKKYLLFFILPLIAISSIQNLSTFLDNTNNLSKEYTIDTSFEIEKRYPGSYDVIEWIRLNTDPSDVIFSGVGNDYQLSSYFSVFSGRQTPIGWPGHESQWRGNMPEINERQTDLLKLFDSKNNNEINNIIKKYNISYIINYKNNNSYLFNIYNKIYSSGSCDVYITK